MESPWDSKNETSLSFVKVSKLVGLWTGSAQRTTGFVVDIEFDYTESVQFVKYYDFVDAMVTVGGYLAFFWWVLYLITPIIAICFLLNLAKVIHQKQDKTYREELNELTGKSLAQLQKIKKLKPAFLDRDMYTKLDGHLMHGFKDRYGHQLYKNDKNYQNENLQEILDNMIRFIKLI